MRPLNRFRRNFRQTDITHFTFLNQLSHRLNCFLDRRIFIQAVQVIQIDVIRIQIFERTLQGFLYIIFLTIDGPGYLIVIIDLPAKLARQNILITFTTDRFSDQLLILQRSVQIGSI
ncbi:hypothetical protein D3C86_950500 [compost metagenome]